MKETRYDNVGGALYICVVIALNAVIWPLPIALYIVAWALVNLGLVLLNGYVRCRNAAKSWIVGRCYGMSRRGSMRSALRQLFKRDDNRQIRDSESWWA